MQSSFLPPTFTQYPFPGENSLLDGNGNVLTDSYRGISASAYDIHNLPISQTHTNGTISYWYDTNGNRVRKQQGGTDHYYVIGAGGETEAVYNWNGSLRFWNIVAGGQLIGKIAPGPTRYYYLKDHLGSIRVTVKHDGTIAGWDDYYPYGLVMAGRSGNNGQSDTKYKFTEKERDTETGYDYFGARYYDSRIGRWLAIDPISEKYTNLSPYNYSANDPINNFDPDGRAIYRKGEGFISGKRAKELTVAAIGNVLSGKKGQIDFVQKNDIVQDIKDFFRGKDYREGSVVSASSLSFGNTMDVAIGSNTVSMAEMFVETAHSFNNLEYNRTEFTGQLSNGEDVVSMVFSVESSSDDKDFGRGGQDVVRFRGGVSSMNKFLQKYKKQLVRHTQKKTLRNAETGETTEQEDVYYTLEEVEQ